MGFNKAEYNKEYAKTKFKRIPLDVQNSFFDKLKEHTIKTGESINGFIKRAIQETIESDNIKEV